MNLILIRVESEGKLDKRMKQKKQQLVTELEQMRRKEAVNVLVQRLSYVTLGRAVG